MSWPWKFRPLYISYSFLAGFISPYDLLQTPERSLDMSHGHQQQRSKILSLMLKWPLTQGQTSGCSVIKKPYAIKQHQFIYYDNLTGRFFSFTLPVPYLVFAAINTKSDQLCSKGLEQVTVIIMWMTFPDSSETWWWGGREEHIQFPALFSSCLSLFQITLTNHLLLHSIKRLLGNQDIK